MSDFKHDDPAVAAAGGVVWRAERTTVQVALVHRPRYNDWTLPKGKLIAGEQPLLGAVREVSEETGSIVEVGRQLQTVEYPIAVQQTKRVAYWAMRHLSGAHEPSAEVDAVSWLTIAEATHRLTYPVDRTVLGDFARLPNNGSTLLLMRHARAGKRAQFSGPDSQRPLDQVGRKQAQAAVPLLAAFNPQRIVVADRVRCIESVQPLASTLKIASDIAPEFSDEATEDAPAVALRRLLNLATQPGTTLICSQGKAIPSLLAALDVNAYSCRKGSIWALSFRRGQVVAADYYPSPL